MMDYEDLGFKCGIEIHQQLDTDTKLFCECSTDSRNVSAYSKVRRKLRPVPGESGSVDDAAKFEFLREKDFVYNVYRDISCLVELDEEPPHEVNPEALETVLQFARMVDCDIPDEIRFMRKLVLDGSNTSGFQRTAIVGLDGVLETEQGEVEIPDIELEEESAGVHKRGDESVVYDLDRLGIPLIEIGTDASIKNPEHAKQAAMRIGMLLRSTGNVKRGLGTIRQDVNVSIDGGARVEIKGFQDVRNLDKLVKNEVRRQKSLLELKEELSGKDLDMDFEAEDVTEVFSSSDNGIIQSVVESGGKVYGVKLPIEGYMNRELCPGKTLGSELSDYSKAQGLNGIMHTDEDLEAYGLVEEFGKVSDHLGKKEGEVVVIAAGDGDKADKALESVVRRAKMLSDRVPEETRAANDDFTTDYSRPLPGSARMYPETDVPPVLVDDEVLGGIEIPETLEKKRERLSEEIGSQLADQIVNSDMLDEFEEVYEDVSDRKFAANYFVNILSDIESRDGVDTSVLGERDFQEILDMYGSGDISKDGVRTVSRLKAEDPERSLDEIVEEEGLGSMSDDDVRSIVKEVLDEKKELVQEQGEHARGALMGQVMSRVAGKADGQTVNRILSEELERLL